MKSRNVLPSITELYQSHATTVLRRARQLLGSETEAQEVLHDVFTSLLEKPAQFRGESSITTFLYRMTTNSALGRLRQSKNRARLLEDAFTNETEAVPQSQEATVEFRQLLARVPVELAQTGVYYYLDEMTQDEIAELMGCSRQRVGQKLAQLKELAHQASKRGSGVVS